MEKKRILIVDDEEDFAQLSAIRLEEAGYDVFTETKGEKVMERVKELKPDLVVLDIILLGEDGFSVLKKLKKNLPDIFVVVVSGRAFMMDDVFKMEGAAGVYKKPIDFKALVKRVQELIGSNV